MGEFFGKLRRQSRQPSLAFIRVPASPLDKSLHQRSGCFRGRPVLFGGPLDPIHRLRLYRPGPFRKPRGYLPRLTPTGTRSIRLPLRPHATGRLSIFRFLLRKGLISGQNKADGSKPQPCQDKTRNDGTFEDHGAVRIQVGQPVIRQTGGKASTHGRAYRRARVDEDD